jgi:hypothetical protein
MAKVYEIKCPYCGNVRKMGFSDVLSLAANTTTMRGEEEKPKQPSPESLDEANWIDFKTPFPGCGHKFSFNIITGESRE